MKIFGAVVVTIIVCIILPATAAHAQLPRLIGIIRGDTTNVLFGQYLTPLRHQLNGRTDLVVDNGRRSTYLYRGGASFDTLPFLRFDSTLGRDMADAGDANGDGYDDLSVLGTFDHKFKTSLYYGGNLLDTIRDLWFGQDSLPAMGPLLLCGDLGSNGQLDGMAGSLNSNSVLIFGVEQALDTVPEKVLRPTGVPPQVYGTFPGDPTSGLAVGDFNGDGVKDLAIGLTMQGTSLRAGELWVYYGGPKFDTIPNVRIAHPGPFVDGYQQWGTHVLCPGDINGDGYDDIAITGVCCPDSNVYIYYGGPNGIDTIPGLIIPTHASIFNVAGDLNGDEYPDLIVADPSPFSGGKVMIYYGGPGISSTPGLSIWAWQFSFFKTGFGLGATGVGDFDGDGINDFAFTMYDNNVRGLVYIFSGDKGTKVQIHPEPDLPEEFTLSQNVPNPFNPSTQITFSVLKKSDVRLVVYNVAGQVVRVLANEQLQAGSYSVTWDGTDQNCRPVASGVYLYRLEAGDYRDSKKMVLIK